MKWHVCIYYTGMTRLQRLYKNIHRLLSRSSIFCGKTMLWAKLENAERLRPSFFHYKKPQDCPRFILSSGLLLIRMPTLEPFRMKRGYKCYLDAYDIIFLKSEYKLVYFTKQCLLCVSTVRFIYRCIFCRKK